MFGNCNIEDLDSYRDRSSTRDKSRVIRSVSWGDQTIHYFEDPSKPSLTIPIPRLTSKEIAEQEMVIDLREVFGKECELDYLATRRRRKSVCFEEEFDLESWAESKIYNTYSISSVATDESIPSNIELEFEFEDSIMKSHQTSEAQNSLLAMVVPLSHSMTHYAAELVETVRTAVSQAISNAKYFGIAIKERFFDRVAKSEAPNESFLTNKLVDLAEIAKSEGCNHPNFTMRVGLQHSLASNRVDLMKTPPGLLSPRLGTGEKASISIPDSDFKEIYRKAYFASRFKAKNQNHNYRQNEWHKLTGKHSWKKSLLKFSKNRKYQKHYLLPDHRKRSLTHKIQVLTHSRRTTRMSNAGISQEN